MIRYILVATLFLYSITSAMELNNEDFFKAIAQGDTLTIEKLLDEDTDIDAVHQPSGQSALHLAINRQVPNQSIIKLLVMRGATINAAYTKEGVHKGKTVLHMAVAKQNVDLVKFLLEQGADATLCTRNGGTPLHIAAGFGNSELVEFLLKYPVDIDAQTYSDGVSTHCDEGWPAIILCYR